MSTLPMQQGAYGQPVHAIIVELAKCINTMLTLITSPYRRLHMTTRILTQEELKEQLHYNPETGIFTWCKSWKVAGSINGHGYLQIKIGKNNYQLHRLAWIFMTGINSPMQIDHINNNRSDNRWCNLREATHNQNCQNSSLRYDNTSGYKGVGWHKGCKKWQARCFINGKRKHLGLFESAELAFIAYKENAIKSYGEFYK